jgi:hypothetical protein
MWSLPWRSCGAPSTTNSLSASEDVRFEATEITFKTRCWIARKGLSVASLPVGVDISVLVISQDGVERDIPAIWCDSFPGILTAPEAELAHSKLRRWMEQPRLASRPRTPDCPCPLTLLRPSLARLEGPQAGFLIDSTTQTLALELDCTQAIRIRQKIIGGTRTPGRTLQHHGSNRGLAPHRGDGRSTIRKVECSALRETDRVISPNVGRIRGFEVGGHL